MSASMYKDQNSVTTVLAIMNQMSATLGAGFRVEHSTTINTKRGVQVRVNPTTFPKIRYFGIGIKGYANLTSENNLAQPYMPSATDCDLYEPIPFRCTESPLTGSEAAKYRMHTTVEINGKTYHQYWLKVIEFESSTPKTTIVKDNIESEFIFTNGNLYPQPNDLFPSDLAKVESRLVSSITGICRVTGAEVREVINAMYGGDIRRATISEFGTYSGCDLKTDDGGVEAVYVQLATHKCCLGQRLSNDGDVLIERKVFENGSSAILGA